MKSKPIVATIESAVRIARAIEAIVEPLGAHVALTGGCLHRGASTKDVDIIFYPHQVKPFPSYNRDTILKVLIDEGAIMVDTTSCSPYIDKDVVIATWNRADLAGIRVDLIFM
jgi:hypothetical protein